MIYLKRVILLCRLSEDSTSLSSVSASDDDLRIEECILLISKKITIHQKLQEYIIWYEKIDFNISASDISVKNLYTSNSK